MIELQLQLSMEVMVYVHRSLQPPREKKKVESCLGRTIISAVKSLQGDSSD